MCIGGLSMPGNWIFNAYTIRSYVQPTARWAGNHFERSRFFKIQGHKGTFNMNELYRGVGIHGDRGNCPHQIDRISKFQFYHLFDLYLYWILDLVPTRFQDLPYIGSKTNKSTQIWKLATIFWSIEQRKKNPTLTSTQIAIQIAVQKSAKYTYI